MPKVNVQDVFLNELRRNKINCTVYLINGVPLRGRVLLFDDFTIYFQTQEGKETLLYKHAISTIIPAKPVNSVFKTVMKELSKEEEASQQGEES